MTKELVKEAFDYGYTSYHECNTDLDYEQHLEDCYVSILGSEYENNNGWIKILSEEDLPKEPNKSYFVVTKSGKVKFAWFNIKDNKFYTFYDNREYNNLTHYQLKNKPNPPIY